MELTRDDDTDERERDEPELRDEDREETPTDEPHGLIETDEPAEAAHAGPHCDEHSSWASMQYVR